MKKYVALLLCVTLLGCLVGSVSAIEAEVSNSRILIAYFTWADNTHVENPDAVDVDATTSASVLPPGNTAKLSEWIQERAGGEIFSLVVTEPYSSNYDECLDRAAEEKARNVRPELVGLPENLDDYDVIFLGYPNWWYTVPMAIYSFLDAYDFSGKTVIPFCAHGTSGLSRTVEDIRSALPESTELLEPFGVYRPDIDVAQPDINAWLDDLGFAQTPASSAVQQTSSTRSITMTVSGNDYNVTLYDNATTNALYEMLPLTLPFEDYNNVEKIAYLPEALPPDDEQRGCEPKAGDLCLYVPWGNLSLFYKEFRHSEDLISLGCLESGIEAIAAMEGEFAVTLSHVE